MTPHKMGNADKLLAGFLTTGRELGMSDRDLAAACMRMALGMAEQKGDPDGWLAMIAKIARKGK